MSDYFESVTYRHVAIIAAGYIGASIVYALTITNLAREIILINRYKEKAIGEALDIQHGMIGFGSCRIRPGDFCDCKDCDLIIITTGRNRRPGETRWKLIPDNIEIIRSVVGLMKSHYTRGSIMKVANPVGIMTYECNKIMGA